MGESSYIKFLLTAGVILLALCGYLGIEALDRVRESNMRVLERLENLERQLAGGAAALEHAPKTLEVTPIANRGYFDPAAQIGGRMTMAVGADTANLNPIINNDSFASTVAGLCSASLAERNFEDPTKFEPMLARSWEVSPDRRCFRIKLRKGVLWDDFTDPVTGKKHASVPVTAYDFKFFFDVISDKDVNCEPLRVYYADIQSFEVHNEYEFSVTWKRPAYGALGSTLGLSPLPRHFYDYDGKFDGKKFNNDHRRHRMIVGCGPYRFVRWEKDQRIILKRNSRFFGNALGVGASLEYLVFDIIKMPNTRFQALLGGKLDRLGLTPDQWTQRTGTAEFRKQFKKFRYLLPQYTYIGWNLKNELFRDKRVRQALTLLTDRERILKEVYYGLGKVISNPFFAEGVYSDPALKPWPYDPEKAKKLLAEAGWKDSDGDGILDREGKKFSFVMMQIASHPIQQRMMPMLKEAYAAAGIDMKIQVVEWSVCIQRLNERSYDACSLGWASPFEPDLYQIFHSSQAKLPNSSNHTGFVNREVDRIIEELRVTFDQSKRVKLSHELCRIFHEEQPYTFLFAPYNLTALSSRYRNAKVYPVGLPDIILWVPHSEQRPVSGL
ncbi:MAG: peptide-binding protein [Lentisphaeria bacterium]|nr:peptide-binding protein [Lentisphaeria bacterium]